MPTRVHRSEASTSSCRPSCAKSPTPHSPEPIAGLGISPPLVTWRGSGRETRGGGRRREWRVGWPASHYFAAYQASRAGEEADALAAQARISLHAAAERAASL